MFDGRNIKVNGNLLVVTAYHHKIKRVAVTQVPLLVRHVGREVDEIARPNLGGKFETFPSSWAEPPPLQQRGNSVDWPPQPFQTGWPTSAIRV
jgi:hypothetical protein